MLKTAFIVIGVILMIARGTGWISFPKWTSLDLGWIGASLVAIGVLFL